MPNVDEQRPVVRVKKWRKPFLLGGVKVLPGERRLVEIPLMRLYTHSEISLRTKVLVGQHQGPTIFLSAAIHGDEINGVEIIRRFLKHPSLARLRGVVIAVPIVNVHGVLSRSRYLPDRRDLNRSFPGSSHGSLAARIAHLFMKSIVSRCEYGIDLHTGSAHRVNLPQVRANLDSPEVRELAHSFGVPVILESDIPDGSLRSAMVEQGKKVLVYEAGEALRFDEVVIRAGLRGIISVLRKIGCLPAVKKRVAPIEPYVARSSNWIRAPESGLFRAHVALGAHVKRGDLLGFLSDPFGIREVAVRAKESGIVIGRSSLPLINEGEALFHIASFSRPKEVARHVKRYTSALEPDDVIHDGDEYPVV
ncbi:MAG: succinylglutamate desuccinylase/aspartoacylase family protein [Bdellovibrionales bacterium]|nr:succinylglutamate desuccinylase/aspartoacylase family protein [Bdellovibrionales bacterium]